MRGRPAVARRVAAAVCAIAAALSAAGCVTGRGDDESVASTEHGAQLPDGSERPSTRLEPVRCPPGPANCRSASGRILYVERVDPDADGDAHFVLLSRQSVTAPGLSVIDVERSLRPSPLPRPGDRLSAAGPVYRGSYGQRQIEAIDLRVARVARP